MRKKIMVVLVGLLMAIPLLVVTQSPASASCTAEVNTKSTYANVDDDETNSYVRFWSKIYYYDCGNYRTLRYTQIGYSPDYNHNSSLSCTSTTLDKVRMNQGSILGNDPGEYTFECAPGGAYHTYDWVNESISDASNWDRGFGVTWTAVKAFFPDRSGTVPYNSF